MPSAILPAIATIPRPSNQSLSSCSSLACLNLFPPFSFSPFPAAGDHAPPSTIRMGGGPRTFPGGVSKWQWKRMQARKAKQLLKARLCRERQLYEMRKRAELKAAISELERPWEVAERAPVLFSASADEQVKVLADRFQRPTGFDMWTERDGPQIFRSPDDLPSARFFPKGAVRNVKPYGLVSGEIAEESCDFGGGDEKVRFDDWIARGAGGIGKGRRFRRVVTDSSFTENVMSDFEKLGVGDTGESLRRSYSSDSEILLAESEKKVADLSMEGGEMGAEFGRDNRRNQVSYVAGSKTEGGEIAGDVGGRSNRSHDRRSRGLDSELMVTDSWMERTQFSSWNRVSHFSDSELALAGSKMKGRESDRSSRSHDRSSRGLDSEALVTDSRMKGLKSGGFDQGGSRGRRGSRNASKGSYQSYSMLPVGGSRAEGDGLIGDFDQRGIRGRNRVPHVLNSEIGVTSARMNDQETGGNISRRGGGGRGERYRGSYRTHSDRASDDSRTEGRNAGDFNRYGNHERRRVVSSSRTEEYGTAGVRHGRDGRGSNVGKRGPYEPYSTRSSVNGDVMTGGSGRRGGHRGSYGSDSELLPVGSRKTRGMTGSFGRSGGTRGYKNMGRVSLRPTTELRFDQGR